MSFNKIDTLPRETAEAIYERRAAGATWEDIESEFDISTDRARMLMKKHGFDHSVLPDARVRIETWSRPCIRCGLCEERQRGLFRCKRCRREGREEYNASDMMYAGAAVGS